MKSLDVIKILAVDDQAEILDLYDSIFEVQNEMDKTYEYDLKSVQTAEETSTILKTYKPDIVILDVYLAESSGLDLCKQIRRWSRNGEYIGIIFVTGEKTPELIKIGLELGADDFCSKNQTSEELTARIRSVIRIKRMADSLRYTNQKLRIANERLLKLTITDELTGLFNMRFLKRRLAEEYTRATRYKKILSILMIDLDYFKQVNDSMGHLMGSYVISQMGKLIKHEVRSLDVAARYGGDEFIILLPETDEEGAYNLADRILNKLKLNIFNNGEHQVNLTASLGIGTLGPHNMDRLQEPKDLIQEADKYLYRSKELGRARISSENKEFST